MTYVEIIMGPGGMRRVASTGGYVLEWNGRGRLGDIYSNWSYNARQATLASGGVVLDHGALHTVQVVDWDHAKGGPADGVDLDSVDLLEVLENWLADR